MMTIKVQSENSDNIKSARLVRQNIAFISPPNSLTAQV